jgi:hypothetical protein
VVPLFAEHGIQIVSIGTNGPNRRGRVCRFDGNENNERKTTT